MYQLSDYQYELPEDLIAQTPADPADSSRLLVPDGTSFHDHHFYDLLTLLTPQDVLFFNDTKVIKARVPVSNIFVEIPHHQKASRVVEQGEIFLLKVIDDYSFEGLVTLTKRVRKGSVLHFREDITLTVHDLTDAGVLFHLQGAYVFSFFEMYGQMPLPPYISHSKEKEQHYQTHFADKLGSVAAPTASLHFTEDLLQGLRTHGIPMHFLTLHVGLGTFKPVDTKDIREYHIHEETIIMDESLFDTIAHEKIHSKNIVAVGTTVARTLESLPYLWKLISNAEIKDHKSELHKMIQHSSCNMQNKQYRDTLVKNISEEQCTKYIASRKKEGTKIVAQTRIFIYPGFERKIVDGLITNFHLPGSTLLMLVASFIGYENLIKMYQYAIAHKYRFFSFGDGMYLKNKKILL